MIVTVANHKGGVGKTSLAAHLVYRAAEVGRVLAVDLDAQGNLTFTLAEPGDARGHATADLLFSADDPPQPMATPNPAIDLLPATAALTGVDRMNLSAAFQARGHLKELAKRYALVVIDSAPALGLRLTAALASSQHVVVPLVPEAYAVEGVASLLSEATLIQEHLNPELRQADFVLNLVNPQARHHAQIATRLEGLVSLVKPYLGRHIAVAEALAERRPVWQRGSNPNAARHWRAVCDQLLRNYAVLETDAAPG